jgi:hypothetical protein
MRGLPTKQPSTASSADTKRRVRMTRAAARVTIKVNERPEAVEAAADDRDHQQSWSAGTGKRLRSAPDTPIHTGMAI